MKLDSIKIVFIDIDGTLVNDKKEITSFTKESIKKIIDKGIYVVLVSGRDIIHTIDKSKLSLASSIVIATNGSDIFDYAVDIDIIGCLCHFVAGKIAVFNVTAVGISAGKGI